MNKAKYWCGCRTPFEGEEAPPFCSLHNDSLRSTEMFEEPAPVEETPEEEAPPKIWGLPEVEEPEMAEAETEEVEPTAERVE